MGTQPSEPVPEARISDLKSEINVLKQEAKKCRRELKEKKKKKKQKKKELKHAKKEAKKVAKNRFASEVISHLDLDEVSTQQPGSYALKTWKVKNTGTVSWSEDTIATFKRGYKDMVSADSMNVVVGSVAPGEVTYIRAMFAIPSEAGEYNVVFRLQAPDAGKFGAPMKTKVFVEKDVEVSEDESEEPEPSAPVQEFKEEPVPEPEEEPFIHQPGLESIVLMGFSPEQAKNVLIATEGNVEAALNLLLN